MMKQALVFWVVLFIVGAGVFYAPFDGDLAARIRWAGGLLAVFGGGMLLYGLRETGQRRSQVNAAVLTAYGAMQFIPSIRMRAILTIPIVMTVFAALLWFPARGSGSGEQPKP